MYAVLKYLIILIINLPSQLQPCNLTYLREYQISFFKVRRSSLAGRSRFCHVAIQFPFIGLVDNLAMLLLAAVHCDIRRQHTIKYDMECVT